VRKEKVKSGSGDVSCNDSELNSSVNVRGNPAKATKGPGAVPKLPIGFL
jgi:hypothetical protein